MFSSLGLFKDIDCPEESRCFLPSCLFAHKTTQKSTSEQESSKSTSGEVEQGQESVELPRKRRRITPASQEPAKSSSNQPRVVSRALPNAALQSDLPPPVKPRSKGEVVQQTASSEQSLKLNMQQSQPNGSAERISVGKETLNPYLVQNPPVSHAIRRQLATLLHDQIQRLNEEVKHSSDGRKNELTLSDQQLIRGVLKEEEQLAKGNPAIYSNLIRNLITKTKRMKLAEWIAERLPNFVSLLGEKLINQRPQTQPAPPDKTKTGLDTEEELTFLSRLLADQSQLSEHGYVTKVPSAGEVEEARQGDQDAHGWEVCDRCHTRFQVFPGRRTEDGALTSGGACVYHPMKPRRPLDSGSADKSSRERFYSCCNETVGVSTGCTTASTHVFKVSNPNRLALILPFEQTPCRTSSSNSTKDAVCFDCEMCYTTYGLELVRLTATSWPSGKVLVDVLVRPLGEVLDLNTRFSGVSPTDFANAVPYDPSTEGLKSSETMSSVSKGTLRMVPSPQKARDLLFRFLTPDTPLIGHALDNDLNATRIVHPSIIDTVLLYPHPRGLPIRHGLKALMKQHLERDIQMGGAAGHDSAEDARAAGELVKLAVAKRWAKMKAEGWTVDRGQFVTPTSISTSTSVSGVRKTVMDV